MAFDLPKSDQPYQLRYQQLSALIEQCHSPYLERVVQHTISSETALFKMLEHIEKINGEGLMLRAIDSYYQIGRSPDLLKLKSYQDAEAVVIGYKLGKGKYKGMVGALWVQNDKHQQFYLGSGLSDADRMNPPKIGTVVIYQYNGYHHTGLPRFARYSGQRQL